MGSSRSARRKSAALTAAAGAYALSSLITGAQAQTLPQGGNVVAGSASINQATPNSLNIVQTTNSAIINWQSFSIGAGQSVNFQQPSAASVTLNRVLGNDPSAIFGTLTANGTVMLVNPNGVFFGPGSRVDVGGLVATTANIKDADFMAGKYLFGTPGNANAQVVNQGDISIKDTGLAALVAPRVHNSGVIRARLGKVALGAAQSFTLDFYGDGLLSFGVGAEASNALVVNSGQIAADGGVVELSARAVKGVIDNVINTSGVVQAKSVGMQNGKIVLSGGSAGKVEISGTVDATGGNAGETGGKVVATGADISVAAGTSINVSGQAGGGQIALGSDGSGVRGRADGMWSDTVSVAGSAQLKADAIDNGDGGLVTVLSNDRTVFAGSISARGGANGGNGGFAEISSHKDIHLTGSADLRAPKGETGTLLIDPTTLKIVSGSGGTQDTAGNDGNIAAGDSDSGANTISQAVLEGLNATTNIVLEASGLITVDTMTNGVLNLQTGSGNSFTLRSTTSGGITFTDAATEIRTSGGAIKLEANGPGSSITNVGKLTSNGGDISLLSTGAVTLANTINAGAGTLTIQAANGDITATSNALARGAAVNLVASGSIGSASQALALNSGTLSLKTGGSFYLANQADFNSLTVNTTHASTSATGTYQLTANGQTFTIADSTTETAIAFTNGGGANLSWTSDRSLKSNGIAAGGTVKLTSTGGDILQGSGVITGTSFDFLAKGSSGTNGAIGASGNALALQSTGASSLSTASGSGNTFVSQAGSGNLTLSSIANSGTGNATIEAAGTIIVGNVALGSSSLTLKAGGSILNDANAATSITANTLSLTAQGGSIGTSGTALTASGGTVSALNASSGGIYLNTASTANFSNVVSGSGAIQLNTGTGSASVTSLTGDGTNAVSITATTGISIASLNAGNADVTLNATAGSISNSTGGITANKVTATAVGSSSSISLALATIKELVATAGSNISVTNTGALTLSSITSGAGNITATASGDITVNKLTSGVSNTTTLTATGGSIIAATGNKITTSSLTLTGNAIGSTGTHLNTSVATLSIDNKGSYYIDNTGPLLTSLTIKNTHDGSTANTLHLTAPDMAYTVTDDGSKTTLSEINSTNLTVFSFTSDKTLVVGQLDLENVTTVKLSTTGSIIDDANKNTRITGKAISLTASENVGEGGNLIGLNTISLAVKTGGNLLLENINHFNELGIESTHKDSGVDYTYTIKAQHLDFAMTDASATGYTFTRVIDSGYGANGSLNTFSFTGDRSIVLGNINTGTNKYTTEQMSEPTTTNPAVAFKSTNGHIKDDGNDTTAVQATFISLQATQGIGGSAGSADIDVVAKGLVAVASNGGVYINALRTITSDGLNTPLVLGAADRLGNGFSATGDMVVKLAVGDIQIGAGSLGSVIGAVTLQATAGSIINSSSNTIVSGGKLTLSASESIGSSTAAVRYRASEIDATATYGSITLYFTGGGGITTSKLNDISSAGSLAVGSDSSNNITLGSILVSNSGSSITISGAANINDDGNDATLIRGNEVSLTAQTGIGNTAQVKLDATKLTVSSGGAVNVTSSDTLTNLTVTRATATGGVSITGQGQSFTLAETSSLYTLSALTSSSDLNFTLNAQGSSKTVQLAAASVGSGGKFTVVADGGITSNGSGSDKITAGEVSLKAGSTSSIGASGSAIQVNSSKLTLNAGRNIYVNSALALTHVYVTSTNATTASGTASNFGITGASGAVISISDSGTAQSVDVTGNITDFSLINQKNISVSEIVATGAVVLTTASGGANSNITMSGGGAITGSSITLSANGTGTGNGSIGTSTRSVKTQAATLNLTSNGNIYIDNSSVALTTLSVTSTHKSVATSDINTYSFTNVGTGRSVSISETGGTQSVAMSSGSGAMDFSYAVDRAISTETIDAGTSSTGKITLTSTGGATGVAGVIDRSSGTLTAGEIILSANVSTNSAVTATTATQKLSLTTGGDLNVSNTGTLTDLTLGLSGKKSSTSYTHSLSSTGLTFTVDEVVQSSSLSAFKLTTISQSGLNLTVNTDRTMQVGTVNIGSGTAKLTAGTTSGNTFNGAAINSVNTSSLLTAGRLEMTGSSIGNATSGQTIFYGNVGTLKATATSITYQNASSLALDGISTRTTNSTGSVTLTVSSGSLTQASSSTEKLSTGSLNLKVANGSIGTSGTALQIEADQLTLTSGLNVYFNNSADLAKLDWTLTHSSTSNSYGITGKNLSATIGTSSASGSTTFTNFVDTSGLDFSLSVDTNLVLGTVTAQSGHALSFTTTGTTKNITTVNTSRSLAADKVSLTATGSIGVSGTAIQTTARDLFINTVGAVHLNNSTVDLQTLSITSTQATGGTAPTFGITGQNLTLSIAETAGRAAVEVTDTTGLDFTFTTVRPQSLGTIDLTSAGTLSMTSSGSILSSGPGVTAGSITLTGTSLGEDGNLLAINTPLLTLATGGDVYIASGQHLEKLKLTNSTSTSTANRTFAITGIKLDGTIGMEVAGSFSNAGGAVFTSITDTSGLDFEFVASHAVTLGTVNLGKANLFTVTGNSGIKETDGTSSILAGKVTLSAASGAVGQASGTGGGLLDITASSVAVTANNGAYLDLKQKTQVNIVSGGASEVKSSDGDLAFGSVDMNGAALTINVTNGSLISGSLGNAGALNITASGAIGSQDSKITTSANSGGTTTLTASAGGGIYLNESYNLTVSSMTAGDDVALQVGSSGSSNFTLAGALTATGKSVAITVNGTGSIKSSTASSIDAASLTLKAAGGSIGESTSSTTKMKTTATNLSLYSSKNIYVAGSNDLTDLYIDRAAQSNSNSNSSGTMEITATSLTFTATDNGTATTLTNVTDTTGLNFSYLSRGNIIVNKIDVGSGKALFNAQQGNSSTAATITATGTNKITAGDLTLTTNTSSGSAIGSSSTALGLSVSSLTASTSGDLYVKNAAGMSVSASNSSGDMSIVADTGDLTLTSLSMSSAKALTLKATTGGISYGGSLTAGNSGSITLEAANSIGSAADGLNLSLSGTASLNTKVTGTGGIYLDISGSPTGGITALANNGPITINGSGNLKIASATITTDALGNDIAIRSTGGSLTLATVTAGANYGAVSIIGTSIISDTVSAVTGSNVLVKATTTGIGVSGTPLVVGGKSVSLQSNNSAIYVKTSSDTTLTSVTSGTGLINITQSGGLLYLASLVNTGGISVTSGANTVVVGAINAGTGAVSIIASTSGGKVLDDGLTTTRIVGGALTLTGSEAVGTSAAHMQTTATSLSVASNVNGSGIYIDDNSTSAITLSVRARAGNAEITTAGATTVTQLKADAGSVKLAGSSGDITLTTIEADTTSGTAEITSAGKILGGTTSGDHVTAHTLKLTSASGIGTLTDFAAGTGTAVKVNVTSIDTLEATAANSVINIAKTGALSLNGGLLSIGSGGSAYIAATGNLTLTHAVGNTVTNLALVSGGTLTLPNATQSVTGTLVLSGTTDVVKTGGADRTFTLSGDALKFSSGAAGGDTKLVTTTTSLDASLTGTGNLTVENTGNLSTGKFSTSNGDITATSSTGITATNVVVGGTNKTATIKATTGDVTATTLNAGGTGTIKLVAEAGSVLMGTTPSLTGNTLDITSFAGIGSSVSPFTTSFANFAAKVTGTGDIHLGFSGAGTTGTLITTDGDIYVTAAGTLTVDGSKITAGNSGNLSLKSTGAVSLTNGYTNNGANTAKSGVSIEGSNILLSAINTSGAQSYKGNTTANGNLTAKSIQVTGELYTETNLTFDTSAVNGDINVTGQLDGRTNNVSFTAGTGKVTFGTDAFNLGTLSISAGNISLVGVASEGTQSYTGATETKGNHSSNNAAINFNGATKLLDETTISTAGGAVNFNSTLDGASKLTINSGAGDAKFVGAVGNTTRLGELIVNSTGATSFGGVLKANSVLTNAGGTLAINGGSVDTTGTQEFNEIVVLGANTTLTGTTVTLHKGVQGIANLAITGNLVLNDKLSADSNLGILTVSGTSALNHATINTTGAQTFEGLVTLGQDTTFTGTTVTLNGGAAGATKALSIVGNGSLKGDIGTGAALSSISVSGTTTLAGGTIVTSGNQGYTGAVNLTGNHVLTTNSGQITFGSTVDSTSHSNLTLNLGDVAHSFSHAFGTTNALGVLTISSGSNGSVSFNSNAHIKTTGDLILNNIATLLLPANIDAGGAITIGVLTSNTGEPQAISGITPTLAAGEVKIKAGGNIVMAGLSGSETDLTISSSGGYIKIGSKNTDESGPQPTKKIVVKTLKSDQASSINMYGTVADRSDATAAYIVGPLKGPPYYINDMRWGPIENQVTIPQSVVPPITTIPTSPQAGALFTRTVDAGGLNPNAIAPFLAPNVLNFSSAPTFTVAPSVPQGGGVNPTGVVPSSSGAPLGTGSGGGSSQSGGANPTGVVPSSSGSPVGGTGAGGSGGATGGSQPGQPNSDQQQQQQQGAAAQ
ncbi:filamentous hemagglutinin N-terminal domain-containing protein [Ferrovibrio sp.]|uniref:filamentous hemagglutinin N-terminal domain-containing protein n=1 Tax=Ferrovibrio sp. TaxID=1917215 RepID=UPI003D13709F